MLKVSEEIKNMVIGTSMALGVFLVGVLLIFLLVILLPWFTVALEWSENLAKGFN